jgi:hypothetical protein
MHLAQAISSHVYSHTLFDRFDSDDEQSHTAVRFIDVADSQEERAGTSWMVCHLLFILAPWLIRYLQNSAEAKVCLEIAKLLRGKEFKIITPYNGQTTLIDKKLKADKDFPKGEREDKCNNVDSFQGKEGFKISSYPSSN